MTRRLPSCVVALSAAFITCGCAAQPIDDAPEGGRVVYLNFADGREGVVHGERDDATSNVSQLCESSAFARWNGLPSCGGREPCSEVLRARVQQRFSAYRLRFTTTRPPAGTPYTMVVIAPPDADCSFGRRGVAHADCGDENPANVAFVFDCRDVDTCALLIAHETAHTFGLVHVSDPDDVMTLAPEDPALQFGNEHRVTIDDTCGRTEQSSHATLLEILGPSDQTM